MKDLRFAIIGFISGVMLTILLFTLHIDSFNMDHSNSSESEISSGEWVSLDDLRDRGVSIIPSNDKENMMIIKSKNAEIGITDLVPSTTSDNWTFLVSSGGSIDVKYIHGQAFLPADELRKLYIIS